jgi:hypothetical protein
MDNVQNCVRYIKVTERLRIRHCSKGKCSRYQLPFSNVNLLRVLSIPADALKQWECTQTLSNFEDRSYLTAYQKGAASVAAWL